MRFPRVSPLLSLALSLLCSSVGYGASDEGRLYKAVVYEQTAEGHASLASSPWAFIADIRNTFTGATGTVSLPTPSTWTPNPFTVVTPGHLVGAHYLYEQAFVTETELNTAFSNGTYGINVTRPSGTSFTAEVEFTGKPIPTTAPIITNTTWNAGTLIIHPSVATISYTNPGGYSFAWELVGAGGSGGGSGSASGLLNLTGMLSFGQTYQGEFRLVSLDDSITINDPLATQDKDSTYSTLTASIVRFTLETPDAADDFSIQSAIYTTNGTEYDVLSLLNSKVWDNNIVWRMDGWELTNGASGHTVGVLNIAYTNADGQFAGSIDYNPFDWSGSVLVLPNPLQIIPEPGAVALFGLGFAAFLFRRLRQV